MATLTPAMVSIIEQINLLDDLDKARLLCELFAGGMDTERHLSDVLFDASEDNFLRALGAFIDNYDWVN